MYVDLGAVEWCLFQTARYNSVCSRQRGGAVSLHGGTMFVQDSSLRRCAFTVARCLFIARGRGIGVCTQQRGRAVPVHDGAVRWCLFTAARWGGVYL